MKLNKDDSSKIAGVVGCLILIAVFIISSKITSLVPLKWLGALALLIEFAYAIPQLVKQVYVYNDYCPDNKRFIPFYNVYLIASKGAGIFLIVSLIVLALVGFLTALPPDFYGTFLPTFYAVNMKPFLLHWFFAILVSVEIAISVCMLGALRELNFELLDKMNIKMGKFELLNYVILMVPVIRFYVILTMANRYKGMTDIILMRERYNKKVQKESDIFYG